MMPSVHHGSVKPVPDLCARVRQTLAEQLAGLRLHDEALASHLRICGDCAGWAESLDRIGKAVRREAPLPGPAVEARLRLAMRRRRSRVPATAAGAGPGWRWGRTARAILATAAVVGLAFVRTATVVPGHGSGRVPLPGRASIATEPESTRTDILRGPDLSSVAWPTDEAPAGEALFPG